MNLVQSVTSIIAEMHHQLSCQCQAISDAMAKGKLAGDKELLTIQRTLNVIKGLRKELEIITAAGMLMVAATPAQAAVPATAPARQEVTAVAPQPAPIPAKASNSPGRPLPKTVQPLFPLPEPQVNTAYFTPEMAALMNGSGKPVMRAMKGLLPPRIKIR